MNRLTRLEEAMIRMSTRARKRAEDLRAQLLKLLGERDFDLSSGELVRVTYGLIGLMGHNVAGARELWEDFDTQERQAANRWLQGNYWTDEGGLFGSRIAPWRALLVQASIDW